MYCSRLSGSSSPGQRAANSSKSSTGETAWSSASSCSDSDCQKGMALVCLLMGCCPSPEMETSTVTHLFSCSCVSHREQGDANAKEYSNSRIRRTKDHLTSCVEPSRPKDGGKTGRGWALRACRSPLDSCSGAGLPEKANLGVGLALFLLDEGGNRV